MNVLSLFDGMSCGQIALERAGIKVDKYYGCEIDDSARRTAQRNYPYMFQLGDITNWRNWGIDFSKIGIIFAGFPCQAWSVAGAQGGDEDPRGALVHDLIDIWKAVSKENPDVLFLFENVKMKKQFMDYINDLFGCEPLKINSALVSAQNRNRLYWTNIDGVTQPEDKGILLKDIIENGVVVRDKSYCIDANYFKWTNLEQYLKKSRRQIVFNYSSSGRGEGRVEARVSEADKAGTLTATGYTRRSFTGVIQLNDSKEAGGKQPYMQNRVYDQEGKSPCLTKEFSNRVNIMEDYTIRKLTPLECERLQTVPEGYTDGVSQAQRYKMLGNGWTVDVIAHILSFINKE